jgi:pyridinium-3,5-bisthiocarboxylic acid mononucleotide nickel chelatase
VIHVKTGSWQGEEWNAAPEFEDCRRAAAAFDVPLKTVMQAAMAAWRTQSPTREPAPLPTGSRS